MGKMDQNSGEAEREKEDRRKMKDDGNFVLRLLGWNLNLVTWEQIEMKRYV